MTPKEQTPFNLDALMLDLQHYAKQELQKHNKPHIEAGPAPIPKPKRAG